MYDLCIVGAGMIGSAAARHASLTPGVSVCLIGPKEPIYREEATIFGAYYDEGRVTRCSDPDLLWATLAAKSISRYRELEHRTGIQFYTEVGCLTARPHTGDFNDTLNAINANEDDSVKVITSTETRAKYRYMRVLDDYLTVVETKNAGYINPRKLVAAEQTAAHLQGADIIEDVVDEIIENHKSDGTVQMIIRCQSGRQIHSRKVLLATGAFTNFRKLFPAGVMPEIILKTQSIIFAEVSNEQLQYFRDMPSILGTTQAERDDSNETKFGCYILPPIKYPDDRYYIKLGHGPQYERILHTERQVVEWYRQGPPEYIKQGLLQLVDGAFRGFNPASIKYDTCVTSHTPTKRPYIDRVTSRLGVAIGGNGYAAKSCDEIGRLAARLLLNNEWDFPFSREIVELKYSIEQSARL